jgi:hypothetical protein
MYLILYKKRYHHDSKTKNTKTIKNLANCFCIVYNRFPDNSKKKNERRKWYSKHDGFSRLVFIPNRTYMESL